MLVIYGQQTESYKKILHNIDQNAVCLDGSPAAIYEHIGTEKSKFLFFFGGGGSCGGLSASQTIENCYQRSKTYLGSSKYMLDELRPQGMLNTDPSKSKFATWNKFIFAYCDGAFHQGVRNIPIVYKDAQLFVRGGAITRAHLQYIQENYNFKNGTQIVITGVSAGAMASFLWTNQIQKMVLNHTIVSTILDSGLFFNDTSIQSNKPKSLIMLQNVYKLANNNQKPPLQQCIKVYSNQDWNCLFLQYAYPYIKGRVLNIVSQYDSYDLKYQYQITCITQGHQGQTFVNCSKLQNQILQKRRQQTLSLTNKMMTLSQNFSSWVIACSNHVYVGSWKFYNSQNQTVSGMIVQNAVQSFVFDKKRIQSIDTVAFPDNTKCAY